MRCAPAPIDRCRPFFELWPTSKEHFLPDGQVPYPGTIFRQPDLARTLRAMAEAENAKRWPRAAIASAGIDAVRDYFYRGEIATQDRRVRRAESRAAAL